MELRVVIVGERLAEVDFGPYGAGDTEDSRSRFSLGIQKGDEVIDTVGANAACATFTALFTVSPLPDGGTNFLGPYAHGPRSARFCYLCWMEADSHGIPARFARIKLPLSSLPWERAEAAAQAGTPLVLRFSLVGKGGGPVFASVPGEAIRWQAHGEESVGETP